MAEAKAKEQTQEQEAPKVKTNKDGFVPGQRVSPKELEAFKLKKRQKAK